jgi:hypothetical protein
MGGMWKGEWDSHLVDVIFEEGQRIADGTILPRGGRRGEREKLQREGVDRVAGDAQGRGPSHQSDWLEVQIGSRLRLIRDAVCAEI